MEMVSLHTSCHALHPFFKKILVFPLKMIEIGSSFLSLAQVSFLELPF